MRILHLASHRGIDSGGAVQMALLARGQAEAGHQVQVAFRRELRPPDLGPFPDLAARGVGVSTWSTGMLASRSLRGLLAKGRFDVIHAHRDRALALLLRTSAGTEAPVLIGNCGNSVPLDDSRRALFADPRVRRIVAVAEAVRDQLVQDGIDARKVAVIYGAVDAAVFRPEVPAAPVRQELGLEADTPVVGLLANMDRKKCVEDFLDAAARIAAEEPRARFLIVGGGRTGKVRQGLRGGPLESRLRFLGFRPDVPQILAAIDVSVSSSGYGEGLSGAMRESLAMARPVCCTDVGGNRELVEDGVSGRVVPPRDPAAMAAAVLDLLRNPERARTMAQEGLRRVRERCDVDRRVAQVDALYRSAGALAGVTEESA